ncbi:Soma ferritin [Nymphon striatum]|nr:Soma ferritin [Nymphon striatum]
MVEELRTASSKVGLEINLIETMASRPRQNFHQESEACINKQINMELYASYVYMSMSYYFDRDDVALKGFAKYFKKASDEEREHAEKFMKYQNKRGGRIALQDVKKPAKDSWDSPIEATKAALALEKEVNQALLNMHKVSDSHGDAQHAKRVSWRAFCSQVSRTNPFSDAYKLCRSEFRRKHLDEPLLDSNGHRYADVAEECKALMNYHLGDEDGIQPETIVTPEGADDRNISAAEINRIVRMVDSIMVEIASLRSHLEDAKGQLVKLISKDRIHKPDTVKYLNKSMKVALAKLSNIEKSVSEGATVVKERPSQPTYANVVAKAVASHRSPPETIIVESQDADIKTAGQLQALVKDSVNLREAKIGVTNIRHAGTKLIIKTQNSVDKGTLVNLINNTLKAKVKVWAPQKWRPNILVKNVPEDVKDDDIVDSILDQNNLAEGGRLLHKEKVLLQIGKGLLGMLFWMSAQACSKH